MAESSTIIEHTVELMVSPTGGLPTLRESHFLKPTVTSIDGPPLVLPYLTPEPIFPLEVSFNGWSNHLWKWNKWVHNMQSRYSSLWKEAGIYEALMVSTCKITRNDDLILGLAERWCSDTNTFVLPWGETTVTLEDVLILGGFSVLGDPVLLPLESELVQTRDFLEQTRENLENLGNDGHLLWMNVFMGTGSPYEHEAFLSLWLSRYVFPCDLFNKICSNVFSIAIHLARGRRLALAPSVLASLYRDLGFLRVSMANSTKCEGNDYLVLSLWSPFHFVQVWAWERLPPLRPESKFINWGEARMSKWDGCKNHEIQDVRDAINFAGSNFLWRPYVLSLVNWSFPKFYNENEAWMKCAKLNLEFESFARCLRACTLVGLDCQEPYNPHRVAMQFGYDQDLPRWIPREYISSEAAWFNYSKPLNGYEMLYVPSRLSESDVSSRYLDWWKKTVLCFVSPFPGLLKGLRSCRKRIDSEMGNQKTDTCLEDAEEECELKPGVKVPLEYYPDVPPGFEPIHRAVGTSGPSPVLTIDPRNITPQKKETSWSSNDAVLPAVSSHVEMPTELSRDSVDDVPPGFGFPRNLTVRKRVNNNSVVKQLGRKRKKLGRKNGKVSGGIEINPFAGFGFRRKAQPVTEQVVGSITGAEYRHSVSSNRAVSDIEAHVSRIEREVTAMRNGEHRSTYDEVLDIEARVAMIKARVSTIEDELAAFKYSGNGTAGFNSVL